MELRHLLYFKTVAEELHFRKAAAKLFVSQPPLSRQIKELEDELGVVLFTRNNKKVELTDAGAYFKKEIDKLFNNLSESKAVVRQIHDSVSGELRIGYISSTFHENLVAVLKEMLVVFPFVKTKLYEIPSVKQIVALEEGKLDIGILRTPINSGVLSLKHLFTDPFVLVTKEKISCANEADLFKYLHDKSFVFFNHGYAPHFHEKLMDLCQRIGFYPDVAHQVNNIHSILQLVDKGLGVSILPLSSTLQYRYLDLCFTSLNMDFIFTEVALAHQRINQHPAIEWFINKYADSLRTIG